MTVTELLNHRLVGIGGHLWTSPSPTLLLKQVHLRQAAQDCIKDRLHFSYAVCSLGSLSTSKFFLMFCWNFLHIIFCLLPSPYCLAPLGSAWLLPLDTLPSDTDSIPSHSFLLQAKQPQLSQPFL